MALHVLFVRTALTLAMQAFCMRTSPCKQSITTHSSQPGITGLLYSRVQDAAGKPKDVFLYNKAHLKSNLQLPQAEDVAVPQADGKLHTPPKTKMAG